MFLRYAFESRKKVFASGLSLKTLTLQSRAAQWFFFDYLDFLPPVRLWVDYLLTYDANLRNCLSSLILGWFTQARGDWSHPQSEVLFDATTSSYSTKQNRPARKADQTFAPLEGKP